MQFLRAAHIKKRSVCTDEERRDISNIAVPACVFGCDALFETGFVAVSPDGLVLGAVGLDPTTALGTRVETLVGRPCTAFTDGRKAYLAWHRQNVFRQ